MRPAERAGYLAHAQSLRHRRLVERSEALVERALGMCQRPYIAFSTGKDSTVMADLVWRVRPDVPAVYLDAECAFPESEAFLERTAARHTLIRWPCEPFFATLERAGGPCADGIEEATMRSTVHEPLRRLQEVYAFDLAFVGLRAEESAGRRMLAWRAGDLFYHQGHAIWECLPVLRWRWADIWAYIASRELDYNEAYDRMEGMPLAERRISYWAGETSRTHGRWAWLRRRYPALWNIYTAHFDEVARLT